MKKNSKLWVNVVSGLLCLGTAFGIEIEAKAPVYEPQVNKLKPGQGGAHDYVPNEVLVKFKDSSNVQVQTNKKGLFRTSSVSAVDKVLQQVGITEAEPLMPLTGAKKLRKGAPAKAPSGKVVEEPDMSRLYLFRIDPAKNLTVEAVIEQLKEMEEVEFAEPNYRVYAMSSGSADTYTSEPLYAMQYAPSAINLPALWDIPLITEERPVIAIIDTGVEIEHPDLAANIWTNTSESDGLEYEDDDANGYVDDLHGWDFVDKTPIMTDPNGHGTHCAGIAAAVGDNGVGITGANPDALIMPIRVMEADGVGSMSVIIQGIDYAVANGADVISMSFGTSSDSQNLYTVLQKAYQNTILVGAAGNDGLSIYRGKGLMFPGAYDIVLGVQASNETNTRASYSNYDPDGGFYVNTDWYSEWWNYEILAPGSEILSTYPGGKYKQLSGTSMATPLVAGAISRLLQTKPSEIYRDTWIGDITHAMNSETGVFDAFQAYSFSEENRQIALSLLSLEIDDSEFGDGDGDLDVGETVDLYPTLRSEWGHALNIKLGIEVDSRYESASSIEVINTDVDFGYSLNSRGVEKSSNPLRIKINSDLEDGHDLKLIVRASCDNIYEEMSKEVNFNVVNGVEIGGILSEDLTLYPNVHYIVTKTLGVPSGVTLTILPGTVLKFKSGIGLNFSGDIICSGTPENPITFTMQENEVGELSEFNLNDKLMEYCIFENINFSYTGKLNNTNFSNCIIRNINTKATVIWLASTISNCNLFYNNHDSDLIYDSVLRGTDFKYLNIISNRYLSLNLDGFISLKAFNNSNLLHNFGNNNIYSGTYYSSDPYVLSNPTNYVGTGNSEIAEKYVIDFDHSLFPYGYGSWDSSTMPKQPNSEAHGIVWKVVVNGYDAQDEYELLPPLGVGKHKFEVYFNRAMNKEAIPTIAMGAQEPYNQIPIAEDGSWNEEGTIYTAYLTISGKDAIDGVNRIYVADAEDDEYFEIPVEDYRFNVNVQSAGSMSSGFMADAGLGKVNLTWENPEENFDDMLGYNLYRYTMADEVPSDTIRINKTLLEPAETAFTDFDVVPGETYYYYYKVLRTSLTENSPSKIVAATPLTASKGDANGSMTVDVADVVTEVAYMTNQNPQPFIFEAADVNADANVNILDVVGTVNIIKNPDAASSASINSTATYTVENGTLYVETPVALGGVQFRISAAEDAQLKALDTLASFEFVTDYQAERGWLVIAYSMTGKTLPAGKHALMQIGDGSVAEAVFSDATGKNVMAISGDMNGIGAVEAMQMQLPYPNPFSEVLNIPYVIGKEGMHDVRISITTPAGLTVANHETKCDFGYYNYLWRPASSLESGIYFVTLYVDDRLMQTARVIYKR